MVGVEVCCIGVICGVSVVVKVSSQVLEVECSMVREVEVPPHVERGAQDRSVEVPMMILFQPTRSLTVSLSGGYLALDLWYRDWYTFALLESLGVPRRFFDSPQSRSRSVSGKGPKIDPLKLL